MRENDVLLGATIEAVCTAARLDAGDVAGPSAGMTDRAPSLQGLRRSLLGAWLAVAYALAVLASALAPASASAHVAIEGATLCSGLMPPVPDMPQPAGEAGHCKGCPVNPVLAGPAQAVQIDVVRASAPADTGTRFAHADAPAPAFGLPQPRAPPV